MVIPSPPSLSDVHDERAWAELDSEQKRERLLAAAGEVFAREGIEAPMPAVAAAAGAGVGSVYRQFSSKQDLLAALVVRRLESITVDVDAALAAPGDAWSALVALLWSLAGRQASDDVVAEAMATLSEHRAVAERAIECELRMEALMRAAREEGALRSDARPGDIRLLLGAVRAARRREPESWRRMLELGLDGLAVRPAAG